MPVRATLKAFFIFDFGGFPCRGLKTAVTFGECDFVVSNFCSVVKDWCCSSSSDIDSEDCICYVKVSRFFNTFRKDCI